jgi:hypothetical protein
MGNICQGKSKKNKEIVLSINKNEHHQGKEEYYGQFNEGKEDLKKIVKNSALENEEKSSKENEENNN